MMRAFIRNKERITNISSAGSLRRGGFWITSLTAVACRSRALVGVSAFLGDPPPAVRCKTTELALRLFASGVHPEDFSVIDDDEEKENDGDAFGTSSGAGSTHETRSVDAMNDHRRLLDDNKSTSKQTKRRIHPLIRRSVSSGATWMERNAKFAGEDVQEQLVKTDKTFREDFRGTRVFVQGIGPGISWQTLKDHFRIAGEVVFASVSRDPVTGETRGHGIVQYETTGEALNAIKIMRDHPLEGCTLFVREDVQEIKDANQQLRKGPTPPSKWKCANEEDAAHLPSSELQAIQQIIRARDQARRRRNYEAADAMREDLRHEHGVHIDDRLRMWWTADGNAVPKQIKDMKGQGRWGDRKTEWRQIPTTRENDACVNPELVNGLLKQRDISRRERDFATADRLLEEARTAPDGDLSLRIHDESRTWRIWTDAPPPRPVVQSLGPAEQCLQIAREHAPEKIGEVEALLEKFPGREYNILKKLKSRYL